jgi:hypothetical protein
MNPLIVSQVMRALMYEGYMLYPYRRSSIKNQRRWNFGVLYPSGMEPSRSVTECLLEGSADTRVDISVRFLQPQESGVMPDTLERKVDLSTTGVHPFRFDGLCGDVRVTRQTVQPGLERVGIEITNRTPPDINKDFNLQSLVSTHTLLVTDGAFLSLLNPPDHYRDAAARCRNLGSWPVLIGDEGARDCMLSSPIILPDYPRAAEESPEDLYDCTEIDEILTLRILTLSDAEKEEIRRNGGRERELLERVESLTTEQLSRLHGTIRTPAELKRGDRVRIHPRAGGDIFDVALAGRVAIVESVERDFENRTHVAVVIEDDPGSDLGLMRQTGHRFFFSAGELERVP